MSAPLLDDSFEFEDRAGGLRAVVTADKSAQIQVTGYGAMRRDVTENDLERAVDLLLAAFNAARTD